MGISDMQPPGSLRFRSYGMHAGSGDAGMQNPLRAYPRNPLSPENLAPRPRLFLGDNRGDNYGAPALKSPTFDRNDSRSGPFIFLLVSVTALKFLFIPAYRSTDFEVHRNWLAVTHSLPVRQWYVEATSEWTLDYPPLFAWMEYLLSHVARLCDPRMLMITKLPYASHATVVFQRVSVIVLDATFVYATYQGYRYLLQRALSAKSRAAYSPGTIYACLMLWNVGLLIVDHIHFQYNGFLLGFVQLAVIRMVEKRYFAAALWFSVALNFKHIFLYMAPPFGIFLLRQCCFPEGISLKNFNIKAFAILGGIFLAASAVSLGPFIYLNQLGQVISRLFPFQRGLTHAYWAPNFWALYNTADKFLTIGATKLQFIHLPNGTAALTGGLVGGQEHTLLPSITPSVTMLLTVLGMLPALCMLWNAKTGDQFVKGLTICTLSSFLFGWHVHEKAILLVTIPYTWLAINNNKDAKIYLILTTAGYFGLHPLLFTAPEVSLKYMMLFLYGYVLFRLLKDRFPLSQSAWSVFPLLNAAESLYILGFFAVALYGECIHFVLHLDRNLPFLPLMITSAYSALGVVYAYVKLLLSGMR
ncbi:probable dolichyl pyrophosphate Glc1Man9GlcNAc2 alpha-1,3-glucosyltransferase [Paramacrobiotus metropolitanus]|uniref:probable dolichyl pyrophosphate Glc1Man9GlcNAc2 alpha-1,3-glucosyltransferase n=1 Tax=Paramacrobiotus metropolitanus TaxID=2943436 RepID=UPI002445AA08|nr:probable dolichyl pyrophosphate Glc1Man9GlcNAc2 alpha-1,3-glucosyltransferase [Paramacrobiotus metropolitanus]XP_055333217.1 probable dolichyl pyrophosphate Glc1Man9GlcNAc2 alpha-1,3-glucosyltransferase [Paramacrobiotus metropolitanus]XP_055333218.1 probable dolichyl pyrophosphate Glc1Man9GlcNAc2 alpha-1,3-glucosyltransferase [Paramacrobiotus metropolitanus]